MTFALIDDHLLLRVLLDDAPRALRGPHTALATTGIWYHRLCRALNDTSVVGALSSRLGAADPTLAAQVLEAVVALPPSVELVSLRHLGWDMADLLQQGARLNLLSLEALAAARHLEAEILLADAGDNPTLRAAAHACGVRVRIVRH